MSEADAWAVVALLPSDQGGRNGPTPERSFGCVMVVGEEALDIRIALEAPLAPGTTRFVDMRFLDPGRASALLTTGTTFRLWEGREIGFGRIERVTGSSSIAAE